MRNTFLVLFLAACAHTAPAPAAVQVGAASGLLAVGLGHELAAEHAPPAACVAHLALGAAATAAASGLLADTLQAPPVDVAACGLDLPTEAPAELPAWTARVSLAAEAGLQLVNVPCRVRAWLTAAVRFVRAAAIAVAAELSLPTGLVSVPPVTLDTCGASR